jgi:hypothetical protein
VAPAGISTKGALQGFGEIIEVTSELLRRPNLMIVDDGDDRGRLAEK